MDYSVTPITPAQLLSIIAFVVAVWGFVKVVKEIIVAINTRHDQEQKWDSYDAKIVEVSEELKSNRKDTESALKLIMKEQCMLTYCSMATLDGLHQLGANGEVTKARSKLDKYMNQQAHGAFTEENE